ncbi:hypothetical protein ABK040_001242 [Willaertia magna]
MKQATFKAFLLLCLIFIICTLAFVSSQDQKKKDEKEEKEIKVEKVIILNPEDQETNLDDLPEDLRSKIKEILEKAKQGNSLIDIINQNENVGINTEKTFTKTNEDKISLPQKTSEMKEVKILDIQSPSDYSAFMEEQDTIESKVTKKNNIKLRRRLIAERVNKILERRDRNKKPNVNEEVITEKLLLARNHLDPDLDNYDPEEVKRAIEIYEEVISEEPHNDIALFNLGTVYKTDKFGVRDFAKSKMYFLLAAWNGNSASQFEVATFYSNNLINDKDMANVKSYMLKKFGKYEEMDFKNQRIYSSIDEKVNHENNEPTAITNLVYSSLDGHLNSHIALGYRYLFGHGVPKSCRTSAYYYNLAADLVSSEFEDGKSPVVEHVRLTDEVAIQNKQSQDDVMKYYEYSASKGSSSSKLIVGYATMYGIRGFDQNGELARRLFEQAADAGEVEAYGALGNMYWKGLGGVTQNNETAFKYFKKGAERKDPSSQNGLGYMYMNGASDEDGKFVLEKDYTLAAMYFNKSAFAGNSEGQYNLGMLYLNGLGVTKSFKQAHHYFAISAQQGQVLSKYQLAKIYLYGLGTSKNCEIAVKFLKSVVEKASWTNIVDTAFDKYVDAEDQHTALILYQQAAEQGLEVAQANVAFMYDRGYGVEEIINDVSEEQGQLIKFKGALKWYQQAAEQGNVEAYVKVGDYYYYGTSALSSSLPSIANTEQSFEKSVYFYRRAKEMNNAQAMFNLGFMHEHGKGLPQDFYLAKRYYDMASESDHLAYFPVILALGKLYAHWGYSLVKDSLLHLIRKEGSEEKEVIQHNTPVVDEDESSIIDSIADYEDYLLALLVGGLLLLVFVRHLIITNQAYMDRRRRRAREIQNQEQQNVDNVQ